MQSIITAEHAEIAQHVSTGAANAWLKTVCYQVVLNVLHTGIEGRGADLGNLKRGPDRKGGRSIFDFELVAIFRSDPSFLKPQARRRLADPMWHGFRHYIPPALLDGFNKQYSGDLNNRSDWREAIEPALESWVARQRYFSECWGDAADHHRGKYPETIENEVEKLRERMTSSFSDDDDDGEWDDDDEDDESDDD